MASTPRCDSQTPLLLDQAGFTNHAGCTGKADRHENLTLMSLVAGHYFQQGWSDRKLLQMRERIIRRQDPHAVRAGA
jgi:hypothetical protein